MHLQENYEMEEFYFSLPHYSIIYHFYLGWHTYDVHFEGRRGKNGGGGYDKNEMSSDVGVGGLASVLDFQKENWICAMTRHLAEPNIIDKKYYGQEIFILTLTSDSEQSFIHTIALFLGSIEQ